MSDETPVLAVVTVAVTPEPIPVKFGPPSMAALARDLAMAMWDEAVVLKKHELTPGQFETLKEVPYFQQVYGQLCKVWNEPKTVQERLALQTAIGLEEVLPDVIARAKVKNEPLQGVAQLVKVLGEISGAVGKGQAAPQAASERFKITINLGADTEVYNKSKPAITVEASEVQPITEGFGTELALPAEPSET